MRTKFTDGSNAAPRFRSVPDTAAILGMSEVTLYRVILTVTAGPSRTA